MELGYLTTGDILVLFTFGVLFWPRDGRHLKKELETSALISIQLLHADLGNIYPQSDSAQQLCARAQSPGALCLSQLVQVFLAELLRPLMTGCAHSSLLMCSTFVLFELLAACISPPVLLIALPVSHP